MLRLTHRQLPIRWALSVSIAATIGAASAAYAQSPSARPDTMALSLSAAVQRAMERNEDIGIARYQGRGPSAQRASARSAFLPQINQQSSYTRTLRGPFSDIGRVDGTSADDQITPLFDDMLSRKNSYTSTFGASQLLFDRRARSNLR